MAANPKYAPQARYNQRTRQRINVNLNTNTDQDILTHLKKLDNVQGYIKALIRADIALRNDIEQNRTEEQQ